MSKLVYLTIGVALALTAGFVLIRSGSDDPAQDASSADTGGGAALVQVAVPEALPELAQLGKRAFEAKCIACHGENASGIDRAGPPLVHKIYEPSHHGDAAFWLATQNGVRAHHWKFGNMPPVEGLTKADVAAIVAYVRALQQANGIL